MTSNPARFWRVVWTETFRDAEQDRNFRSAGRAARQCAAILACPDEVASLTGVWVTSGYANDRLGWTRLDPHQLVEEASAAPVESELDDETMTPSTWLATIHDSWRAYTERSTGGGAGGLHAHAGPVPGTDVPLVKRQRPPVGAPSEQRS